ncbi:hypothetical protein FACS1894109_13610 [Spirochaetia bacterium]|nr:hypothetical protein FACS1894109_13610 [Spirochaetia bacterium]
MFTRDTFFTFLKNYFIIIIVLSLPITGCASTQAYKDLNELEENRARGDPTNPVKVKEYLQTILDSPEGYEVKAYERRAYAPTNKKTIWIVHSFYGFFKDGKLEHTLVFTATPKGSELNGSWMLDAETDVASYNLITAGNPWEVIDYSTKLGYKALHTEKTIENILKRLDEKRRFFGASSARDLAWYHQIWMWLVPPPILTYGPLLLLSINADNCTSAVLETMIWEK